MSPCLLLARGRTPATRTLALTLTPPLTLTAAQWDGTLAALGRAL